MTSSFVDLTAVGSGKSNGISAQNIAEARRQFTKGTINAAKHEAEMRYMHDFRMASAINQWEQQLQASIRHDPQEIYTDTLIAVTGFEGGTTLYIEAGKLHEAGMSIDQILSGVTADDIDALLEHKSIADLGLRVH